jgi:site-specific DNA-methyltransferase (cytosine-N4-specific)
MKDGQLDLFARMAIAYADAPDGVLDNGTLYRALSVPQEAGGRTVTDRAGRKYNADKRTVRWHQQTAKQLGLLERVERGVWRLSGKAKKGLHEADAQTKLIAFSTDLGIAIWARNETVLHGCKETFVLCFTSTPYPLQEARVYGNPNETMFTDFISRSLEPVVQNLAPGGSIVLNVSNDIFLPKSPARSLYIERMVIALHDRLGLFLMDRIPWVNLSKPPAPTWWACTLRGGRKQLCTGYEPILWFTNDPTKVRSDNRRVLQAHTERHQRFIATGGNQRVATYGDGAYVLKAGSYANVTAGSIPKNVIQRGHSCRDTTEYRRHAIAQDLPVHGAMQPTSIPEFFIKLLTEPGDLVLDLFGGKATTGLAAERLGRRWMVIEMFYEYLFGGSHAFRTSPGFQVNQRIPI